MNHAIYTQDDKGSLRGKIIDRITKQPLIGANVVLLDETNNLGTATDEKGEFELKNIPIGPVQVKFSMIGYSSIIRTDIVISKATPAFIKIELEPAVIELKKEAVVKGEYFYKPIDVVANVHNYSAEEIRRAAGSFGDISRMMQSFAGVITTNDLRNDILVRGGNPTENLFLVDGFEVQTINHFSTQGASGGAIGFLQTEFLKETNFYPGGFSAKYGGRLSAAMDIRFIEADSYERRYKLDLGTAGAGFMFEGPVEEDLTFMFSVRRSFLELFSSVFGTWGAIPVYTNLNSKLTFKISNNFKVNVLFIGGNDKIFIKDDPKLKDEERNTEQIDNKQRNYLLGISAQFSHAKNLLSNLYLSRNHNYYFVDLIDVYEDPGRKLFNNKAYEILDVFKYELTYLPLDNVIVDCGVIFKNKGINQNTYISADTANTTQPIFFDEVEYKLKESIFMNENYLNTTIFLADRVTLNGGIRTYYNNFLKNDKTLDLRLGISYLLLYNFKVNLNYGSYSQMPELTWLYSPRTNTKNDHLLYIKSRHYLLGFEYFPFESAKFSLDLFYKTHKNYPLSTDYPFFSLLNSGENFGSNLWFSLIPKGTARHYGCDASFHKKLADNFYGVASYSYLRSYYKALDGKERKTSFDIPHSFNLSGGYVFGKGFEVGFKAKYFVGQPTFPLNKELSRQKNKPVFDETRFNEIRNPDYFRFDLKLLWRTYYNKATLTSGVEFFNLTNKKNLFIKTWNKRTKDQQSIYQYSFMFGGFLVLEF